MEAALRTREKLDSIPEIPTLPAVLIKVWDLTSQENTSAEDLAKAMSADPGLTGAVLKLANSAYFGFPRKIATVAQAIVVLGFETVKSLSMGASVFRALSGRGRIDANAFFRHSLVTATASRILMERIAPQQAGTAFSAGVLHDLGKLVMAEFLPDEFGNISERMANGAPVDEAEKQEIGMTHSDIGAWFAIKWMFPEELTAAVRWHHRPAESTGHREFVAAVHVGDVIAHRVGAGCGRPSPPDLDRSALSVLQLSESDLEEIAETVSSKLAEAESAAATFTTV